MLDVFGQDNVLRSIHDMLDGLQQERGSIVLLRGAAGSGKTHLLDAAAGEARHRGVPTVRVMPDSPPQTQVRSGPRLVLVDDAHRIPVGTLKRMLIAPSVAPVNPVAVLLTMRPFRPSPVLERLLDVTWPDPVRLTLEPLTHQAAVGLATSLLSAPPDEDLLSWILTADGDLRLSRDLVEGLVEEGRVRVEDGLARLGRTPAGPNRELPQRVVDTIRVLLDDVSAPCRQLLFTAAVLGPRVDPPLLAEMLGQSTAALLPLWEEALSSEMLRATGGQVGFVHELLRQAITQSLPATFQAALQRQVQQLRSRPEGPGATSDSPNDRPGAAEQHRLPHRLTAREHAVLSLLTHGRSNQQIARSLQISSHAVKRHVSNLMIKFGCSNRTEVALLAVRLQPGRLLGDPA